MAGSGNFLSQNSSLKIVSQTLILQQFKNFEGLMKKSKLRLKLMDRTFENEQNLQLQQLLDFKPLFLNKIPQTVHSDSIDSA